ncbi:hypothetical protein [Mycobacterium avium]
MSVAADSEQNVFAEMLGDNALNGRTVNGAPSMSADDAEEIGYAFDDDDDDETPRDETETDPDADLKNLTEQELFNKVFYEPKLALLENIVDMARGWQLGSPFGVLGKAIGVAACDVPNTSFLSGTGSTRVVLNFLLGMVGDPGTGKGMTMGAPIVPLSHQGEPRTSVKVINLDVGDGQFVTAGMSDEFNGCGNPYGLPKIRRVFPASGPAFVAEFFDTMEVENEKGKKVTMPVRHNDPIWAEWNEVDQLVAKARGVSGSTLDTTIRSVFTGEDVGDKSISRAKDGVGSIVEAGTYRCIVVVGIQPDRAAAVIKDGGGGTLQRYIFFLLADDDAPPPSELMRIRRRMHKRMGLPMPENLLTAPPTLVVHGPSEVSVSDEVIMALLDTRHSVLTRDGSVAKEDTHANNNRLRLAAIIAGWKAEPNTPVVIDMEAWMWAGAVMEYSRRRRAEIAETIKTGELAEAAHRGRLMGVSKEAAEAHQEQLESVKAQELALKLVAKLTARPKQSLRDLKNSVSHKQRALIDQALIIAEENGQIIYEDGAWFAVVDGQVKR